MIRLFRSDDILYGLPVFLSINTISKLASQFHHRDTDSVFDIPESEREWLGSDVKGCLPSCDFGWIHEVETLAAPDLTLRIDVHVKVCDDAEVVAASAESEEEVW
tara:strand:- start:255 stop:569 length:315 start_codon:yes stop_codon:yes gene_type:complete